MACAVQRCRTPHEEVQPFYWRGRPDAAFISLCQFHAPFFEEWSKAA